MGEVVNMIGGNLKGIANGEMDLSLPTIARQTSLPGIEEGRSINVWMTCSGSPFVVRVRSVSNVTTR